MHGEDLLVNDGCDRQAVEAVRKCLPQLDVVPALALIVETVDAVNRGALVVATQNEEVLWILDLVGQQEADGFERLLATVDVVAKEQVVGLWGETAVFEQAEEVIVLTVDVAADLLGVEGVGSAQRPDSTQTCHDQRIAQGVAHLNRSLELEQDWLGDEYLAGLGAKVSDLGLKQLDLLARTAATDLQEPVDYRVQINVMLICHGGFGGPPVAGGRGQRREEERTRRRGWCALRPDEVSRSQAGQWFDALLVARLKMQI